jgi:parallel beta-helix repeat protein
MARRSTIADAPMAIKLVCLTGLVAGALLLLQPGHAAATHVTCGQTITQNTTLDSDLSCTGTGIVIGAPRITLDLNGHTVAGDDGDEGIDNSGGYDGVRIVGGTVQDFFRGVLLLDARRNVIDSLSVTSSADQGLLLVNSSSNRVSNTTVSGTGANGGIVLSAGSGTSPRNASANEISGNTVTGGGAGQGIYVGLSSRSVVSGNTVSGAPVGIAVAYANGTKVQGNTANANTGDGIRVFSDSPPFASRTSLVGNTANSNGDDGIEVDSPDTTITGNTANNNIDWGIDAVAGVNDGGGNTASGNGQSGQCLNVTCGP